MIMKKLMAALLAAAMVLSSQSFSVDVFAAEPADVQVTVDEADAVEIVADDDTAGETEVIIDDLEAEISSEDEVVAEVDEEDDEEAVELIDEGLDEEIAKSSDYFDPDETTLTISDEWQAALDNGATWPTTVSIPVGVEEIPTGIFDNNTKVEYINFDDIDNSALTTIADGAFMNSGITKLDIPRNVDYIGEQAFMKSQLKSITFKGNLVEEILDETFSGSHLEAFKCDSVKEIGKNSFKDIKELTNVNMKELKTIGDNAFSGCTNLGGSFTWPTNTLETIGNNAFESCGFELVDFAKFRKVTSLGNSLFANNVKLKEILDTSPEGEKSESVELTYEMFRNCTALTSVTMPDNTRVINSYAFGGCTSLKTITILSKVYMIDSKAFDGCTALTTIEIRFKPYYLNDGDENPVDIKIYPDAFPEKTGVTMKGFGIYTSKVRDYADYRKYTFVDLSPTPTIKLDSPNVSVTRIPAEPKVGEKVTLKLVPILGQAITEVAYGYADSELQVKYYPCEYVDCVDKYYVFEFVMPAAETVYVRTKTFKGTDLKDIHIELDQVDGYEKLYNSDNLENGDIVEWAERGNTAFIRASFNDRPATLNTDHQNWLFTFTSTDYYKACPVSHGWLYGLGYGDSVITATYKYNTAIKFSFTVHIEDDVRIMRMLFDPDDINITDSAVITDADPLTGYPVITINKALVEKADLSFNLNVRAYTFEDDEQIDSINRIVDSRWASTDPTVAAVKSGVIITNINTITIKKGSQGEAQITASCLNTNEKTPNTLYEDEGEDNIAHIIIRVADFTPRLGDKEITVNNQILSGKKIDVVPVYGYEINDDQGLKVCVKKIVNGVANYDTVCPDLEAVFDPDTGDVYLRTTNTLNGQLKLNQSKVYTDIYLCGMFKYAENHTLDGIFRIPCPKITVINTQLQPRLTLTGKINTFYNPTAAWDEIGYVKLSESVTDVPIIGYKLVSTTNHNNPGSEKDKDRNKIDSFAMNFDIRRATIDNPDDEDYPTYYEGKFVYGGNPTDVSPAPIPLKIGDKDVENIIPINQDKIEIVRSALDPMKQDSNKKDVTSGYLYIYFEDYREPCKVPLTVPTQKVAPIYRLSKTAATANLNSKGQEYKLYLYPNGKANDHENAVDLSTATHLALNYSTATATTANFDKEKIKENIDDDYITLKIKAKKDGTPELPKAGTASIGLRMSTWADSSTTLYYSFKLNTTSAKPAPRATATSKNFNKMYKGGNFTQYIDIYSSDPDCVITDFTDVVQGEKVPAKNVERQEAYDIIYDCIDWDFYDVGDKSNVDGKTDATGRACISIHLPDNDDDLDALKTGTYSFKFTPEMTFLQNGAVPATGAKTVEKPATITIRVVVQNAKPSLRFGSTTFTFNARDNVDGEELIVPLTAGNLLAGTVFGEDYDVIVDDSDLVVYVANDKNKTDISSEFEIEMDPQVQYVLVDDKGTDDPSDDEYARKLNMKITPTDEFERDRAHNTGYVISGLKIKHRDSGDTATVADVKVNVKGIINYPVVSATQSGVLNIITAEESYLKLVSKISYVNAKITKVEVHEIDETGEVDDDESERFYIEEDEDHNNIHYLKIFTDTDDEVNPNHYNPLVYSHTDCERETCLVKDAHYDPDVNVKPNVTYKVKLRYFLDAVDGGEYYYDVDAQIKPSQTFPLLTYTSNWGYIFAGANNLKGTPTAEDLEDDDYMRSYMSAENRKFQKVTSELGIPKAYVEAGAAIVGFEWGKGINATMKEEFYAPTLIGFRKEQSTGKEFYKFCIYRRNPAEKPQNAEYPVYVAPIFLWQDPDTISPFYTFKINVRK